MTKLRCFLFVMAAAAAAGLAGGAQAKSNCVLAGGEATMVTEDLAKFMAQAALKNSISGMNAKPEGKIALKCETTTLAMTFCTAKQRACK